MMLPFSFQKPSPWFVAGTRWLCTAALSALVLAGCGTAQRLVRLYGPDGIEPRTHRFEDGGSSVFYRFSVPGANGSPNAFPNAASKPMAVFLLGGSGCPSWRSVLPDYVKGLPPGTWVWAMNKRDVTDRSTGMFECGSAFHRSNRPDKWVQDQTEFIRDQLARLPIRPAAVVVVGVSEGALIAARVAKNPGLGVSHVMLIGGGGWTLRQVVEALGETRPWLGIEAALHDIANQPDRLDLQWWGHPYRWWADVLDLDPVPDLLGLNVPVFAVMGEKDASVPAVSLLRLAKGFALLGKHSLHSCIYPGADHTLSAPGRQYRVDAFQAMGTWVAALRGSASPGDSFSLACPTAGIP